MGKTKNSNLATVPEPVDISKPVVKDFIDRDSEMKQFILTHLPHIAKCTVAIKKVYQSYDKSTYRFRVNYHRSDLAEGEFIPQNRIVGSKYIEVQCKGTDYEFLDKTQTTSRI